MVEAVDIRADRPYNLPAEHFSKEKRKDTAQGVAVGVGATGAVSYQAQRVAAKNGIRSVFTNVTNASRATRANVGEVTSLYGKFVNDVQRFSRSIMARFAKLRDVKVIGTLVKSPMTRGIAKGFGVAMAFFALVTGLRKAVDNGRLAVNDIQEKLNLSV